MDKTDKALQAAQNARKAIDLKFGKDIVLMDIRDLSTVADYFIIATGASALQIQAMAAAAEESLARDGYALRHTEGMRTANWVLLDFGDILVHLFDKESRPFYHLERVWGDARLIEA